MKRASMLWMSRIVPLVLASLSLLTPLTPTCAAQAYSVTVLPALNGLKGTNNHPTVIYGMNKSGQVTGVSPSTNDGPHAFLWTPGTGILDLGAGKYSHGGGVNDLGHVAGQYLVPSDTWHAFLWTPDNGLQELGPTGESSQGTGLNNVDQVIGELGAHAFRSTPGASDLEDLGTLGGTYSFAYGINDSGQVMGLAQTNTGQAPFFWSEATGMLGIDGLGDARGINEVGQVAGETLVGHAALWTQSGGIDDLGILPGTTYGFARGVNNHGVAVGNSWAINQYPGFVLLWSPTQGMLNVNSLCKNKLQNWTAVGINDAGQIAINKKGGVAVLLTPIIKVAASSSQDPSHVGQSITLTATTGSIAGPPPDGETITFMDSTTVLGSAPLVNGSATITLSSLGAGVHPIKATYAGDTNYSAATSKVLQQKVVTP